MANIIFVLLTDPSMQSSIFATVWLLLLAILTFQPFGVILPESVPLSILVGFGAVLGYFLTKKIASGKSCNHKTDLTGKYAIVTGCNTGIGLETVLALTEMGCHVILACRDENKAQKAVETIVSRSKKSNVASLLQVKKLDLSSFDSVCAFINEIKHSGSQLDLLVNNAGVMNCPFKETNEGFEMQFGTNHMGHFFLTTQLIDLLVQSKGRIVNVSSLAHIACPKNFFEALEKMSRKETYSPTTAYGVSKMANIYFSSELNKRYGPSGVTSVSLHPGAVQTELTRHTPLLVKIGAPLINMTFKKPVEGAQTSIFCSIYPKIKSGEYYNECKVGPTVDHAKDTTIARELWEFSENKVKEYLSRK